MMRSPGGSARRHVIAQTTLIHTAISTDLPGQRLGVLLESEGKPGRCSNVPALVEHQGSGGYPIVSAHRLSVTGSSL